MQQATAYLIRDQILEVKYEDLCLDHKKTINRITDFCDLNWSKKFEKTLARADFRNTNDKWKNELTDKQQKIINEILQKYLQLYRYQTS